MNKALMRRLAEVEARTDLSAGKRCETCRSYPALVFMDEHGQMDRPEVCPDCGTHVPIMQVIQIAVALYGAGYDEEVEG